MLIQNLITIYFYLPALIHEFELFQKKFSWCINNKLFKKLHIFLNPNINHLIITRVVILDSSFRFPNFLGIGLKVKVAKRWWNALKTNSFEWDRGKWNCGQLSFSPWSVGWNDNTYMKNMLYSKSNIHMSNESTMLTASFKFILIVKSKIYG
jgi:hypothetical protein